MATTLNNVAAGVQQLLPVIAATRANVGVAPAMTLADAGYASEASFAALTAARLPACAALGREGKQVCAHSPDGHPATQRVAERVATREGQDH